MKLNNIHQRGFIAITSLLIITTIAMVLAMSMLMDGISNSSLSLDSIYYEDARINAKTCLEDVILRIRQEYEFDRDLDYQISEHHSCLTTIEWGIPQVISPTKTERLVDLTIVGKGYHFERTFLYELKVVRFEVSRPDDITDYLNSVHFISINEDTD